MPHHAVEVLWDDPHTEDSTWLDLDSLGQASFTIRSVGFLLKKDKRQVVLVQSLTDDERGATTLSIPRGCIRRIRRIR